jgi:predicted ATPase
MRLSRVDVRFFRSFNYDYELKARQDSSPAPWEDTEPAWYPFVRVPLDGEITAIVGANEAGKSQLLAAIKVGLSGEGIERSDFCRYSEVYSVAQGKVRYPEFGIELHLRDDEPDVPDVPALADVRKFILYRPGDGAPFVVADGIRHALDVASLSAVQAKLPKYHELRTDLAIPDSVSVLELAGSEPGPLQDRKARSEVVDLLSRSEAWTEATLGKSILPYIATGGDPATVEAERKRRDEFNLAHQLLVDAAGIDTAAFTELREAIRSGREGQVEAIVGAMNASIKENLNIQRWWSQDRDFDLRVEAREYELAFTIRDRTGSKYSFGERSQGLRFFLSYFVQLAAHRLRHGAPDVLLLDEPDAFLSSIGQQDLLRVLKDYASPEDGTVGSQVVYVTHSPFLIDKNAPHRIRVLDKGTEDEGTRVVRDAANNRYEPLRSSLGSHVAETAFIGGQNLFVEGLADQILLAGISAHIARSGSELHALDLNRVTIVAAGGADSIPYMIYLARGRDSVKPPCVALLDGDQSGRDAEKVLKRGEARKKRVLRDEYIVRLDKWAAESEVDADDDVTIQEIEDLIPVVILHRAALNHLARFIDLTTITTTGFSAAAVRTELKSNGGRSWDALSAVFERVFTGEHLEKAGLAREVVALLDASSNPRAIAQLIKRFGSLLSTLAMTLDDAADAEEHDRGDDRLKRAVANFLKNYTRGIRKHAARKLVRELQSALVVSEVSDVIVARIQSISRQFELDEPVSEFVSDFEEFRKAIKDLGSAERIAYQDEATADPAALVVRR